MAILILPHAPASAAFARHQLVAGLTELGVQPAVIADAELLIAEMVGNAICHARPLPDGKLRAAWELRRGQVLLGVTDGGGATLPVRSHRNDQADDVAKVEAECGRGLAIVDALARDWGSEQDAGGLRFWATLDLVRS